MAVPESSGAFGVRYKTAGTQILDLHEPMSVYISTQD